MKKTIVIDYVTDDPTGDYIKAIRAAKNKKELLVAMEPFRAICDDAFKAAKKFDDKTFKKFEKDWKKAKVETDDVWCVAFNNNFGDIVMPRKLVFASLVALNFHVPWGCAYTRCEENGWK